MRRVSFLTSLVCLAVSTAMAQDPVKVEPKHYKVEFENAQVRVLRINYGPHEKSVMHDHPASVVVLLTEAHVKHSFPNGKAEERHGRAGETRWAAAERHLPENLSDKPFEVILVEQKAGPAAARPARKAGLAARSGWRP